MSKIVKIIVRDQFSAILATAELPLDWMEEIVEKNKVVHANAQIDDYYQGRFGQFIRLEFYV